MEGRRKGERVGERGGKSEANNMGFAEPNHSGCGSVTPNSFRAILEHLERLEIRMGVVDVLSGEA